jgi:hypothetical protein
MAYTPVNLGDVYQAANAIRGAYTKNQLGAIALQKAQTEQANTTGIQSTLASTPNAQLSDLQKYGPAGVKAAEQIGQTREAQTLQQNRQLYVTANQIANADDPIAAVKQYAPQFPQQYDSVHGQGAFAQVANNPDQVKQMAAGVAQHALLGLVDPDKQFAAQQTIIQDHYKQEGPGGEAARNQNTVTAENARSAASVAAENTRAAAERGVQMRGQNITSANDLKQIVGPDGKPMYVPAQQAAGKEAFNAATYFPGGTAGGSGNGLTGTDFLATLAPTQASQVKALAEGRMAFPAGFALKSPYWQQMMSAVSQYDPNFDAVNYNARSKTRADFTSGKSAQNIKALNTAIGHLGTLDSQIGDTASHSFTPLNMLENAGAQTFGAAGPTQFKQTAGALASELTSVFRGQGGAEADVNRYLSELDVNASQEQKKAAVKNIVELLASRTAAIGDQYNQGMGTSEDPLTLLNSKAQGVLNRLRGTSQAGPQAAHGAAPTSAAHPPDIQALLQKYK